MADTDKENDVWNSIYYALGNGTPKSRSIKTDLPSDNLGFWLTQGVPTALVFAHILMEFVGEREVGLCFVPSTRENPLDPSQIQYITEFCVNQASDHDCFDDDGTLTEECKFNSLCEMNTTLSISKNSQNSKLNFFDSLFVYRNYVWFLFIFAFGRGVPQILWKVYFTSKIEVAIEGITIFAESRDYCKSRQHADKSIENRKHKERIEKFLRLVEAEGVKQQRLNLCLFYIIRKAFEIVLDVVVIALISAFLKQNSTPFHKLVFVCDLHRDRDNIFLCDILQKRFVSCTVSFGFEFMMTLGLQLFVFIADFIVQVLSCIFQFISLYYARTKNRSKTGKGKSNGSDPDVTSMYKLCDIYLIRQLQKLNKVNQENFLKIMMVDYMMDGIVQSSGDAAAPEDQEGGSGQNGEPSQPDDNPSSDESLLLPQGRETEHVRMEMVEGQENPKFRESADNNETNV